MKRLFFCFITALAGLTATAQNDSVITVHEWGTFTTLCGTDGTPLSGLYLDEEKLPAFVYDLDMRAITDTNAKGIVTRNCRLKNVTVKMETPVLYFYADKEVDFKVRVDFNGGQISQWYPQRSAGTPHFNNCNGEMDFEKEYRNGYIEWEATVQKPGTAETYTEPALTSPVWVAPRATKANLIKTKDSLAQTEKYLFYRGIGSFDVLLDIKFNADGLFEMHNNTGSKIAYAIVYHKPLKGNAEVWWAGNMAKGVKVTMWPKAIEGITLQRTIANLKNGLAGAGLYREEAEAMIKTWEKSYFETPGVKVFWIVPRAFTDSILPLQMTPLPKKVERVMVGRSEILSPGFEEFIYEVYRHASPDVFEGDRYAEAYRTRYEQIKDIGRWQDTGEKYYVYPNGYTNNLYILAKTKEKGGKASIVITGPEGLIAPEQQIEINNKGYIFTSYGTAHLAPGTYTVDITAGGKTHSQKVVIERTGQ